MASSAFVIFQLLSLFSVSLGDINIVRGVELKNQAFYDPNQDFRCFDGSKSIPFSSVNDDYCDCADASDEPGTAACPNGKYFCTNIGHRGQYLPSSRVNDGICDCCDGSDEYDSHVVCFNECQKYGQEELIKKQKEQEESNAGFEKKKEYIQIGQERRQEKQTKFYSINDLLEERRKKLEELRAQKETAEAPEKEAKDKHQKEWDELQAKLKEERETIERAEAFSLLDFDKNGWVSLAEMMVSQHIESDLSENDAKDLLGGEGMLDAEGFKVVWNAIKPKFLKDGRKPTDGEQAEPSTGESINENSDGDKNEGGVEPVEEPTTTAEKPISSEGELKNPEDLSPELMEQYRKLKEEQDSGVEEIGEGDDDDDHDDEDDNEPDNDLDESGDSEDSRPKNDDMPDYDDATKALIEVAEAARREFNAVDDEVKKMETEHRELDEYLKMNFGKEHEFSPLKGECYEYTDREYIYKLCPFDKVTQRNKGGGSETDLGRWGQWEDGDGYTKMKYENGQGCWNGPARSTTVRLSCGKENTVISVAEPSRCEYEMNFKTPALCAHENPVHIEL